MTYKNWCKNSTSIIAESERRNAWMHKAKHNLLSKIGPRIAKLGKRGYMGCGFHYDMEQIFGRLIERMAIDWQPCANWCKNVEDDRMKAMGVEIGYKMLLKRIEKAEKQPLKK